MDPSEIDDALVKTLADRALSRGEKEALAQLLRDADLDDRGRALVRSRAFDAAREAVADPRARATIDWLEEVVKLLVGGRRGEGAPPAARGGIAEAHFSPGEACRERIIGLLRTVARTADLCVFTIADDRLTREIRAAHGRGVAVRIVTDDDKANDAGSDVDALARAGIPVVVDRSPYHMHHKFALFDGRVVLTGSYNWTRSAAEDNEENVVVLDDPRVVRAFAQEFERLWAKFA